MNSIEREQAQQPKKKRFLGPRVRYALFLVAWIGLIAIAFNTFFAAEFAGRHPSLLAHAAYVANIAEEIQHHRATADTR